MVGLTSCLVLDNAASLAYNLCVWITFNRPVTSRMERYTYLEIVLGLAKLVWNWNGKLE